MIVFCDGNAANIRRAYKRPYQDGQPSRYRAYPSGENELGDERPFETEEELAYFALRNPDWKILVKGPADPVGNHINRTIKIEGPVDLNRLRNTERV